MQSPLGVVDHERENYILTVEGPWFTFSSTENLVLIASAVAGRTLRSQGEVSMKAEDMVMISIDDHVVNQSRTGTSFLPAGMSPTDVWRKNFLACYITEPSGLNNRHRLGVDTIAWECDYPHSDSTWPNSPEMLEEELDACECTDEEIDKITFANTAKFFDWDPFEHIPCEEATVGALRARATDVDISETSQEEYRRRYELTNSGS